MLSLALEPTNLCNRTCSHCLRDKLEPRESIPLDLAGKVLGQARTLGVESVHITGGEAALYPDLDGLVAMIVDHGFRFGVVTNGFRFRERMLPLLTNPKVKKKLAQVCFSLDGARAASHDAIRGEGSFREVMEAAALCRLKGIPVSLNSIITNLNMGELTEVALLGAALGASDMDFIALLPTPGLIRGDIIPPPGVLAAKCRWVMESLARSLAVRIKIDVFCRPSVLFWCDAFTTISVDHQGNLVFCCALSHVVDDGRAAVPGRERIADLREVPLKEGIARHFDLLAALMRERLNDAEGLNAVTYIPCYWCYKRFGKLDWLRNYPDSPWAAGMFDDGRRQRA